MTKKRLPLGTYINIDLVQPLEDYCEKTGMAKVEVINKAIFMYLGKDLLKTETDINK